MPRFFLTDNNVSGTLVRISGDDAHHVARVLRLRPGDHIEVAFGSGEIGIVELRTVCRDAVEGQIVQRFRSYQEPPLLLFIRAGKGTRWILDPKSRRAGVKGGLLCPSIPGRLIPRRPATGAALAADCTGSGKTVHGQNYR